MRTLNDGTTHAYIPRVLEELSRHGLQPQPHTSPQQLRDAVLDLYKYEIRRLRSELLARRIRKADYAGHVLALRRRYWLLSLPVESWIAGTPPASEDQPTRNLPSRGLP